MTHELECLQDQGFTDIILTVSHLGNIMFLSIFTSNNSKNIMNATVIAKASGIKVIGLTGEKCGELVGTADVALKVPETVTYMIEELHLPIYYCWCLILDDSFLGRE